MGTGSSRSAPTRDAVLSAALAIMDEHGLRALSIRALASAVGAPPMTLYGLFRNKKELLDLAFDHLFNRLLSARAHSADWESELEGACRHARGVLLGHPNWIPLLTRIAAPRSSLVSCDRLLRMMLADGFAPEAAILAFSSAMSLAVGCVLVERLFDGSEPVPSVRLAMLKRLVRELPRGAYPGIEKTAASLSRWSFDKLFDLMVSSLIRGIDAEHSRGGSKRNRVRATR